MSHNPNPDPLDANANAEPATDPIGDYVDEYAGCEYCLGGFVPAGRHPVLGLVYRQCSACTDPCPCCRDRGLFPADTTCIHCLTEALAVLNLTPVFCHTCTGVINVHPSEEVTR
jgi:hypothetical protein